MPALKTEYVTLGGLAFRSQALNIFDFADLLGSADKTGDDFDPDQTDGVDPQERWDDGFDVKLMCRVKGRWATDNTRVARASWVSNFYSLLGQVRTVAKVNTTQTLTLTRPGVSNVNGTCIVTRGIQPVRRAPDIATFQIAVRLVDGEFL